MTTNVLDEVVRAESLRAEAATKTRALETEVRRYAEAAVDAVADTRVLEAVLTATEEKLTAQERVVVKAPGGVTLALGDMAHRQLADRTGIPWSYYERMLENQPDLACENINRWLRTEPDTRMIRCLQPVTAEDAQLLARTGANLKLRAVLGRAYLPLDNAELLASVLPVAEEAGVFLRDFNLTDQRLYARFVGLDRDIQDVRREYAAKHGVAEADVGRHLRIDGQDIAWVEEPLRFGFQIRNSETGYAALDVASFFDVLKCLNGYVASSAVRRRHVGKRLEAGEDWTSDQTRRLRIAGVFSEVADAVREACDTTAQATVAMTVMAAKAEQLDTGETPAFQWLGNYAEKLGLTEAERDTLKDMAAESKAAEKGFTKFAVAQAFTAASHEASSFERKQDLEKLGWQVLNTKTDALLRAGRASRN